MADRVISKHEMNKWIPGCPVLIKELSIISSGEDMNLNILAVPCTDKDIAFYTADIQYFNARREIVGTDNSVKLKLPSVRSITQTNVAYAEANVLTVTYSGGSMWQNNELEEGIVLPEQTTIWQTDPLYKVIKAVTNGKVNAKYYPDTVDGGWRCACGGVNVEESQSCGECGCSREWLSANFDREYLASQQTIVNEGKKPRVAEPIKKREAEKRIPDSVKMVLIMVSIVLAIALALVYNLHIIPHGKYKDAIAYAESGSYQKAIDQLKDLGDYKDAKELIEHYTYEFYVLQTGLTELYITSTDAEPWFDISDNGVLEFVSSKYKGTYEDFKIPHVVNGIIVKELCKNFLINSSDLETVIIPDTVEIIGEQAFYGCKSLKTVVFGNSVHTIAQRTFIDCASLEKIVIPDTVTRLGQRMFNNCTALRSVTLGSGITDIGAYTFSNCPGLEEIILNAPISIIGESALVGCNSLTYIKCNFSLDEWIEPQIESGNEKFAELTIITND